MTQSATKRSLDILELLVRYPSGLGLTGLCEALHIPKSVAHRLLALLCERGFVRQHPDSGRYGLTLKLTLLGSRFLAETGLSQVTQPILDGLAAETGELARLAVVEGERMVWVAKAQGARYGLRLDPDTGTHVVLHATATGKAWLATLPEAEALRIVAATSFETPAHFGPRVIRDVERFGDELRRTRARGFGLAMEEGEPGTAALAVAVHASGGRDVPAVATLSLAGPAIRFTSERQQLFVRQQRIAAAELSALWPLSETGRRRHRIDDAAQGGKPAGLAVHAN